MATAGVPETSNADNSDVVCKGVLTKQGGQYRNWKKRYFVLKSTTLSYYAKEGDEKAKGDIDLTKGRGVRAKNQTQGLEWPDDAKSSLAFGLAIQGRTYYFYGTDAKEVKKWKGELQSIIQQHGNPIPKWSEDSEGLPEPALSKVMRNCAKVGSDIVKKFAKDSGIVDDETAGVLEGVADGVKNQAEADRDASITDRLKMAGGDAVGVVGDNVDNDVVGVVCDNAKEQIEADDDVSMGQRLGMAAGTTLQGTSGMVDNDIGAGVMNTTGGIIHDQAEADTDATVSERIAIGIGSAADGVGDSVDNDIVKEVSKGVKKVSDKAVETLEEERKDKEDSSSSSSSDEDEDK